MAAAFADVAPVVGCFHTLVVENGRGASRNIFVVALPV
jgi:hypothetical protein